MDSTPESTHDLTGYSFATADGGVITVTGPAPWDSSYVLVTTPAGPSVRAAGLLRRRKELES